MTDTLDRAKTGTVHQAVDDLLSRLEGRDALLGIIGLGYVGLPLSAAAHRAGFRVIGFDVDESKISQLMAGRSPVGTVPDPVVEGMRADGRFSATSDVQRLREADALIICVPTPIDRHRNPDLSYVVATAEMIATVLRPGQIVVLESTTWPGTTDEVVKPILETTGLAAGVEFLLAYSPEREDPGNPNFETSTIPRVVGADDDHSRRGAELIYGAIVERIVPVSSTRTAEAVKLTENIYRAVNIALVNELKLIYGKMGINIWEVIDAAKSKPFGFQAFYPGPGLGGHCIPIDPFYLTWKAREFEVPTRFIELAGEVNADAPREVLNALLLAMGSRLRKSLAGSRILLLGLAYKKNVDDMRESPSLKILEELEAMGAQVEYFDPHIPVIPRTREHAALADRRGIDWSAETLAGFDAALICTDHDNVDYQQLVDQIPLVVDSRNATRGVTRNMDRVVLA
ncbi:nucleotide sugar dehydrogenase [Brevundimonas sp.]|uniref:nucleotide sugar dehydrogenase n=1 Tax=Brevundimonas sp. TaxID=1871086 RepID=UPI002D425DF2|nr:nucleotide sugar dehydrogenase [Brevundimonas sp.]HYC67393.1 nucleotide sugar dehydrogenase [Brevundimonas sp.]